VLWRAMYCTARSYWPVHMLSMQVSVFLKCVSLFAVHHTQYVISSSRINTTGLPDVTGRFAADLPFAAMLQAQSQARSVCLQVQRSSAHVASQAY